MRASLGITAMTLVLTALVAPAPADAAVPLCFGKEPTVVLTNGNDTYTPKEDVAEVIWAGGGDDRIHSQAESGNGTLYPGDYICGGPGNDAIFGDAGPDHINGGDGNDNLDGWVGNDVTRGNAGNDRVEDDPIESNLGGHDILRGGTGHDVMVNNYGNDTVYGGAG